MTYSIDTSALLDGWVRNYPPENFPGVWENIDKLIASGQIHITEEVLVELEKKHDDVFAWAKTKEQFIYHTDSEIQSAVRKILAQHKRLVDNRKNRSTADPFVIALAMLKGCTVISGEAPSGRLDRPKIPDVCKSLGVDCISLLSLIKKEKWVFKNT